MIPVLDLKPEIEEIREEIDAAIRRVIDNAGFILGPEVAALEEEVSAYLDGKTNAGAASGNPSGNLTGNPSGNLTGNPSGNLTGNPSGNLTGNPSGNELFAVGVNSGTDALVIALRALGIGKGDEVITTPFSFFASAESISILGAEPVFVDVDSKTFNIDPELIGEAITPRTKAIMPVHLYGRPAPMNRIMEIADKHGLAVVEDCAQSFGARYSEDAAIELQNARQTEQRSAQESEQRSAQQSAQESEQRRSQQRIQESDQRSTQQSEQRSAQQSSQQSEQRSVQQSSQQSEQRPKGNEQSSEKQVDQHSNRMTGTIGHAGAFSFFPSKNLGGFGDGGLVVTHDPNIAEKARMLRVHGSKKKYHNELPGYNSRLDSLQAAVLRVKLPHIDRWNEGRRQAAQRYNRLFSDQVQSRIITPEIVSGHVFHQYTVRLLNTDRDRVHGRLKEEGIGSMIYYPVPQDRLPVYRDKYPRFPVSDELAGQVLSLPIWPSISKDVQKKVVERLLQNL